MCTAIAAMHAMSDAQIEAAAGLSDATLEEKLRFWARQASPQPERQVHEIRARAENLFAVLCALQTGRTKRLTKRQLLMLLEWRGVT